MNEKHITIVAFCGPSGSGKSELVQRLLELYPDNLTKWKQATTRAKRGPGDDYVFMTKDMYDVVRSTLTCRTAFNGNYYGTFPEPTAADTAVLTIADAMGLSDLVSDVKNHNNHVENGHKGKFGDHSVRLVKVLMTYDLTSAEQIAKRGADRNGTRDGQFLQQEEEKLRAAATFDSVIDSTTEWADPVDFFASVIWPAIAAPYGQESVESLYAKIEHQLIEVGEGCRAVRDLPALQHVLAQLEDVAQYVNEWVNSEPEPADSVDAIDDVLAAPAFGSESVHLDGAAQMDAGFDSAEQIYRQSLAAAEALDDSGEQLLASDYVNDRPVEGQTVEPSAGEIAEEPLEPLTEAAAEENLVAAEVTAVEIDVSQVTAEETPTVEAVVGEVEQAAEEVPAEVESYSPSKPYAEIFAEVDITDWMLGNTIGIEAFENDAMFKTIFQQYVSAHGGNPNGIEVTSQVTKDGKGGRVLVFNAQLPGGGIYVMEFNERLKRAVKYGPL
jgi:energy-coupling factor transporter ATP-binding protein EcfA2